MLVARQDQRRAAFLSSWTAVRRAGAGAPLESGSVRGAPVGTGRHGGEDRLGQADLGLAGVHAGPRLQEALLTRSEQVSRERSAELPSGFCVGLVGVLELAVLEDGEGDASVAERRVVDGDALQDGGGVVGVGVVAALDALDEFTQFAGMM